MKPQRNLKSYAVWVIVPSLDTDDPNLQCYYDFEPAMAEYTKAFAELGLEWKWKPVSILNIEAIIDEIIRESAPRRPLVVNLCDGDELNGVPGVSVIRELEKRKVRYSGADEFFYFVTTSKITMKHAFDAHGVATPKWEVVDIQKPAD